jgi:flagellar motility protein MotE (MotC chaperone)
MPEEEGGKSQKPKAPGKIKAENQESPPGEGSKSFKTLEDQIGNLEKELDEKKEDVSRKEKDLTVLRRASEEINRVSESYGKALEKLKKDKEELVAYYETKMSAITKEVDEKKEKEILEKIAAVDKEIKKEEEKSKQLQEKFEEAKNNYDDAEKKFKKVKDDYDSARNLQRKIEKKLIELNHTRKLIEEEEKKRNFANVYFLIDKEKKDAGLGSLMKELAELFKSLKSLSPGPGKEPKVKEAMQEFKKVLEKSWQVLLEPEKDLQEKEKEMLRAKEAFEKNQTRLEELRKARKSSILEKLKEIKFSKEE